VVSWVGIFENILTAWELEASNHCAMLFGTEKSEMGKITHIREFAVMHHHGATGLLPYRHTGCIIAWRHKWCTAQWHSPVVADQAQRLNHHAVEEVGDELIRRVRAKLLR